MVQCYQKPIYRVRFFIFLYCICLFVDRFAVAQERLELNTVLMESTFKIEGKKSIGTVFIIGRVSENDPKRAYYVLVTAAHVLNEMQGDTAQVVLRRKTDDGVYHRMPYPIQIRQKGIPLWVQHEEADVAAMYIAIPSVVNIPLLPTDVLANDSTLNEFEIHPGDELMCLGYPLNCEANEAGFPILRSGKIASYPLTPTKKIKTYLYDAEIFKGNSGGPVYFVESGRTYHGTLVVGTIQFIAGMISEERLQIESGAYNIEATRLNLAKVIHAIFIKETMQKLPKLE